MAIGRPAKPRGPHPFEEAKSPEELKAMQDSLARELTSITNAHGEEEEPEPQAEPVDESPAAVIARLEAEKKRMAEELDYAKFVEKEKQHKPHANFIPGFEGMKHRKAWEEQLATVLPTGKTVKQDLIERGLYHATRHEAKRGTRVYHDDANLTSLPL